MATSDGVVSVRRCGACLHMGALSGGTCGRCNERFGERRAAGMARVRLDRRSPATDALDAPGEHDPVFGAATLALRAPTRGKAMPRLRWAT